MAITRPRSRPVLAPLVFARRAVLGCGVLSALWAGAASAGPVNINTADAKTLARELAGVGTSKAEAIVRYRREKGPFKASEDIKRVEGIGEAVYEANRANIRVAD